MIEGIDLGHKIFAAGLEVEAKISLIKTLIPPTIIKRIRSFLGHAVFYTRFIQDFLKLVRPLCKLLENDAKLEFDETCSSAFKEIKAKFVKSPIMATPNWSKEFEIMCDASDYTMGVVLGQRKKKIFRAFYYVSKTFNKAQKNYSTTEKKMMVIVFICEKFRSYILGSHVRQSSIL